MSFFHALEDGLLNDILHDLRLIKAVGGTLISASVSGDELEPDEIGSLACLVHDSAKNIMQTLDALESKGSETTAQAQEGFELDPEAQECIFKDAERLQDMASELALVAEGLCHDMGLELPPNIKEKIAREKAAQAGQGGAA